MVLNQCVRLARLAESGTREVGLLTDVMCRDVGVFSTATCKI